MGFKAEQPTPPNCRSFGERSACRQPIRLSAERGWSQEALALEAGLHRTFVAHVERQARNISLDNLERLAVALEVAPYKLLRR